MTIHPTPEEIHDWRHDYNRVTRRDAGYLLAGIWAGVLLALVIFALGDIGAQSERPTICADYHGAECVAAIEEAR